MAWQPIKKLPNAWPVQPNLLKYAATYKSFPRTKVRRELQALGVDGV